MFLSTLIENPLDLSLAQVVQNGDAQLVAVTVLTPVRMVLATIFGLVALYFVWSMWRGFAEFSWLSLWPGILFAPVFGILSIVFFFGHHEKEFQFVQRKAVVRGGLLGLAATNEYSIPLNGRVLVTLRKELNRTSGHVSQYQYHYDVTVEPLPAMGFTVAGERAQAQEFAKKLAGLLDYELVDKSADPDK